MVRAAKPLSKIYQKGWSWPPAPETRCGHGSEERYTREIRAALPGIITQTGSNVIEAGCGDLHWLRGAVLPAGTRYAGYDVCEWETWPALRAAGWDLRVTEDVTTENLPACDLIICRAVMIHWPDDMCLRFLELARSRAAWLLATTYENASNEGRIARPGKDYSRLDLTTAPFSLGTPAELVHDGDAKDRYLGLWDLRALNTV
jgi:hypothetical protein